MTTESSYKVSFWTDENVLKVIVVLGTRLCEHPEHH